VTFALAVKDWSSSPLEFNAPLLSRMGVPTTHTAGALASIYNENRHHVRSNGDTDQETNVTSIFERQSLAAKLYAAKQSAKQYASVFGSRISQEWRKNLFWQLDELLSEEEWDEDNAILDLESWKSFLTGMFVIRPAKRPGIGITENGNVVASWGNVSEHLDMEFRPGNEARWVLSAIVDAQFERSAESGSVLRLLERLAPYSPERWFGC